MSRNEKLIISNDWNQVLIYKVSQFAILKWLYQINKIHSYTHTIAHFFPITLKLKVVMITYTKHNIIALIWPRKDLLETRYYFRGRQPETPFLCSLPHFWFWFQSFSLLHPSCPTNKGAHEILLLLFSRAMVFSLHHERWCLVFTFLPVHSKILIDFPR